ncbi:hypothetical protein A3A21_01910 [Candidatus Jorgensenbacteria bacterium RIFCSPLOWO2_01_FULL_45_25b]|uniref:GNAT family N-acetyltransferase n=1 Tax=Candidatus Jorgensenbacteria bacterium RIFCSPLOWO2_01_FULL_45_25b TaxID=1798471 RepID=A0A1F6BW36_9BACT|nr:MAG: hypothetical protein A3A21_01910 [Candidatus Jorgensenbacteria bacterium RIFCSPLOWO2_01_FULL_45_25b]
MRNVFVFTPAAKRLNMLLDVERRAWGTAGGEELEASSAKIKARLTSFREGITLAVVEKIPAGSQYAFRFDWDGDSTSLSSWEEGTKHGWTDQVHVATGNTGFLVGVGVNPEFRGEKFTHNLRFPHTMRISELLIARTLDNLFEMGVEQVIANARIPLYHTRPEMGVDEYCELRQEDGAPYDPVLRFHERMGAKILKPVEYSMEDAESRNGGCWVLYSGLFSI